MFHITRRVAGITGTDPVKTSWLNPTAHVSEERLAEGLLVIEIPANQNRHFTTFYTFLNIQIYTHIVKSTFFTIQ